MAWLPLDPALLQVGLYIKLDYSWLEHPFIRNAFSVSSPSEIAIIQKHRLIKLHYDPDRSNAEALALLAKPAPTVAATPDSDMLQDIEEDEKSLQYRKEPYVLAFQEYRDARDEAGRQYRAMGKRSVEMLDMLHAGQAEGLQSATEMVTSLLARLAQPSMALLLAQADTADAQRQELAAQAVNVSVLALLTGARLNLSQEESLHVGLGGLLSNVGMHKLPLSLLAKKVPLSPTESSRLRLYPQMGKEILEAIPGMSPEVVRIVYQHREYLDGSGFPNGSVNGDIAQVARVVGAVTEYHQLTSGRHGAKRLSVAQALSHLYVNMRLKLGVDVVEPFIAAMTVYPPGSFVELSDNSIGLVVKINPQERMRPIVMLYDSGAWHHGTAVIDLSRERSLTIRRTLDPKSMPREVAEALSSGQTVCYAPVGK
jgi:HD-GYP domain-containing protein (c-di-GMP phosphodiesterase class II)